MPLSAWILQHWGVYCRVQSNKSKFGSKSIFFKAIYQPGGCFTQLWYTGLISRLDFRVPCWSQIHLLLPGEQSLEKEQWRKKEIKFGVQLTSKIQPKNVVEKFWRVHREGWYFSQVKYYLGKRESLVEGSFLSHNKIIKLPDFQWTKSISQRKHFKWYTNNCVI